MSSLEEALGEVATIPEEIKVETEVVAEKGETAAEAETPVEPPSTETHESTIPITAFHGVRDELKGLKSEFEKYRQQHPEQTPEPTSFFEDENAARDELRNEFKRDLNNTLLNEGIVIASEKYDPDLVAQAMDWARTEAAASPFLVKQFDNVSMTRLPLKAVEVYQREMERSVDPAAHDAKVAAKAIEDYKASLQAEQDDKEKLRASIPKTLVGDSSKGGIKSSDWAGPTELKSIIG